ncbi:hypothetical protein BDV11DRAFT_175653 [Aspergillus similis]
MGLPLLTRFMHRGVHPEQAAEETDAPNSETEASEQPHWIRGVHICTAVSSAVLVLNVILLIIAAVRASRDNDDPGLPSFEVIYDGSCAITKRWDTALHLLINILSTAILAASNYTMQTLVAPSREEVDEEHNKGRWLDIGTPSTRNLFVVGRYRVWLWAVLLITATPFHLLYNSVVFGALATNEWSVVIAASDLDPANILNYTTQGLADCFDVVGMSWATFAAYLSNGTYKKVDAEACYELTTTERSHGLRLVVGLSNDLSVADGGDLAFVNSDSAGVVLPPPTRIPGTLFSQPTWVFTLPANDGTVSYNVDNFTLSDCTSRGNVVSSETACADAKSLATWLDNWRPQWLEDINRTNASKWYTTNDCLIIETDDRCKLVYNLPLCLVVIGAAVVKVAAMFLAAKLDRARTAPLLTVGDAVASFMSQPDPTTLGQCWITRHGVQGGMWNSSTPTPGGERLRPRRLWIRASSLRRWMLTLFSCGATMGVGIYLLVVAARHLGPFKDWWTEYGFGEYSKSNYAIVDLEGLASAPTIASVLVANTPQFAVTVSYYFYNNVLTTMLAASEYDSYGVKRRGLRLSWPKKGTAQRSTYWLSIPYKYSVPLLVIYMALHWTISQSLFYVQVVPYDVNLQISGDGASSYLSYSPIAILISILLGALMVAGLLLLAFCRRYRSLLPLAGSCSVAISAACHLGVDEDLGTAALGEVIWGETGTFPEGVVADDGECDLFPAHSPSKAALRAILAEDIRYESDKKPVHHLRGGAPECPRYLVRKNRLEATERSLKALHTSQQSISAAISTLHQEILAEATETAIPNAHAHQQSASYLNCFRGTNWRRTRIACSMFLIQQLSGIALYAQALYFLGIRGFSMQPSFQLALGGFGAGVLGNVLSWLAMKYIGRRPMLFTGTLINLAILLAVGVAGVFSTRKAAMLYIANMINFVQLIYAPTIGAVSWSISGEISSVALRAKSQSLYTLTNAVTNWLFNFITPYLINSGQADLGDNAAVVWAALTSIAAVWVWFEVPETRICRLPSWIVRFKIVCPRGGFRWLNEASQRRRRRFRF